MQAQLHIVQIVPVLALYFMDDPSRSTTALLTDLEGEDKT